MCSSHHRVSQRKSQGTYRTAVEYKLSETLLSAMRNSSSAVTTCITYSVYVLVSRGIVTIFLRAFELSSSVNLREMEVVTKDVTVTVGELSAGSAYVCHCL